MTYYKKYTITITAVFRSNAQKENAEMTLPLLLLAWKQALESRHKKTKIEYLIDEE
jgi:hypothetical protein